MSNVSTSHQFERDIAKLFRDAGYDVVRGAASKGKLAGMDIDLVVSRVSRGVRYEVGVALFQCKRSKVRTKVSAAGIT